MLGFKGRRKKIGLALGSGDIRGIAHIGVLKSLVKHEIPIDLIAGTSAGALIGGAYAATGDIERIEKLYLELSNKDFLWTLASISLGGGQKNDRLIQFLHRSIGKHQIADLPIPFCAVASDLQTGQAVMIKTGDLALAIRASSSLPLIFKPFKIGKHAYLDGACSEPVPVPTVKAMGAEIIIAVNLDSVFFSDQVISGRSRSTDRISVLQATIDMFRYHLAREQIEAADIVIDPNIHDAKLTNMSKRKDIIRHGEKATDKLIPAIKALLK